MLVRFCHVVMLGVETEGTAVIPLLTDTKVSTGRDFDGWDETSPVRQF